MRAKNTAIYIAVVLPYSAETLRWASRFAISLLKR